MRTLSIASMLFLFLWSCQPAQEKQLADTTTVAPDTDSTYLEKGRNMATASQAVLASNLVAAIKDKGTVGAIVFCHTQAVYLTDSMGRSLGADIKRVSDRNRNAGNSPNAEEQAYILRAKESLKSKGLIDPKIIHKDGKVTGYYPIVTNTLCLQCHGQPNEQIMPETMAALQRFYPDDLATGYAENELRGIWVVEMDK